jgi:restriction endonuclease Mrr
MKKYSSTAIQALKEALTNIYWTKKDLRGFIYHTIEEKAIVSTIDWGNNQKRESVYQLIDRMTGRPDIYDNDLLRLFDSVMHFNDFSHLKQWDDPETKIRRAEESVKALRTHASGYFTLKEEKDRAIERRKASEKMQNERLSFQQRITELRDNFFVLISEDDHQKRGYLLEKFLNELFLTFDLDPKEAFKITGEQIDGAFTFDSQDYLLEAKWQKTPVQAGDLYKFGGKIAGKFKSALGLFISINGFSPECTQVDSPVVKSMILMDGQDLMAVLDSRIKLIDMLLRKRRHAVEKGDIFLPFAKF